MPKDRPPKAHHSAVAPKPYARPASAARPTSTGGAAKSGSAPPQVVGPALNKDFGQHLLVNPLVVNGIIEKVRFANAAGLVKRACRLADEFRITVGHLHTPASRRPRSGRRIRCWKSVPVPVT